VLVAGKISLTSTLGYTEALKSAEFIFNKIDSELKIKNHVKIPTAKVIKKLARNAKNWLFVKSFAIDCSILSEIKKYNLWIKKGAKAPT
jgi:hypothetical protein